MGTDFTASVIAFFSAVSVLVIVIDFQFSYLSFQKVEETGKFLGLAALAAGIVTFSYVASIRTSSYLVRSVSSSIYFICIDWMLISLVCFTYLFTERHLTRESRCMKKVIAAVGTFDSVILFANIFNEIAVSYAPRDTAIAPFYYDMKPLYIFHLIFTYLLVGFTIYILGVKISQTPRQYQNQYWLIIIAIVGVVLMNALFLYPSGIELYHLLDWSIFGYSIALIIIYWAAFEYRHKDMLTSLSMTIFQNINQGIVLFDHEEELIMKNQKAERLFPDVTWPDRMRIEDFITQAGIPDGHTDEDRFSVQCSPAGRDTPIRLDSSKLRDHSGAVTGHLLVFTEPDDSTDILTGFENWEHFHKAMAEDPYDFDHPTAVAVFDIIGLGRVNHTFGYEVGNQRLRGLASAIRKFMPGDTRFVRGYEANLLAVCQHSTEADILDSAEKVRKACGETVLYGLSETLDASVPDQNLLVIRENAGTGRNVLQAVDIALHALQVKKLLNSGSNHSQTLTSLVRALQESDSDTEAHVKRTQKMGNALGTRVGLTDAEQADLSLLCLLHDIGKIGIPLEILNKPGKLTDSEWAVLRTHAEKGYEIAMSSDELKDIAVYILHHHERWDGNGYPEKLVGSSIPLLSRIISVVDAYDAMVNTRSYRKALTPEAAQAEIQRCSGTQFDPMLAEEFLQMLDENPDIMLGEKTGGEIRVFKELEDPAVVYGGNPGTAVRILDTPVDQKTGNADSKVTLNSGERATLNSGGFDDIGPAPKQELETDFYDGHPDDVCCTEEPGTGAAAGQEEENTSSVPFCHYILDIDDRIVEVDPMFTDITGFTPGEAIGNMTQFDLIPGEDRARYIDQVNEQFKNGNIAYLEHNILRKDGTRIRVNCIGKRYYDSAAKAYRSEILVSRI
ncbi:MAG: HD domain-containing protein [Eubacterium sp.]|nr:HD domain-containing protein [Eubacterium sp.]